MIAQQFARLNPQEQRVLEAASVAGSSCTVAAVAAGLALAMDMVEECCAGLAQRGQFLVASGLYHRCREVLMAQGHAEAVLDLATAHGFSRWMGPGPLLWGPVLVAQGQDEAGLQCMQQGLATVVPEVQHVQMLQQIGSHSGA